MSKQCTGSDDVAGPLKFLVKYNGGRPIIWTYAAAARRLSDLQFTGVSAALIRRAVQGGALAHHGIHTVTADGRDAFVVVKDTAEQYTQIGGSISTAHFRTQRDPPPVVAGDVRGALRAQQAYQRAKRVATGQQQAQVGSPRSSPRQAAKRATSAADDMQATGSSPLQSSPRAAGGKRTPPRAAVGAISTPP